MAINKKMSICIALCFLSHLSFAQQFINGDFEDNFVFDCEYNLSDSVFNERMKSVKAIGRRKVSSGEIGEVDIQTFDCLVDPQSGKWCLGLNSDGKGSSDIISIELNEPLSPENNYELSFFAFANTVSEGSPAEIEIGEAEVDSIFGTTIMCFKPLESTWNEGKSIFRPIKGSKYITVRLKIGNQGWNQVDNFDIRLAPKSDVNCLKNMNITYYPNPVVNYVEINLESRIPNGVIKLYNSLGQVFVSEDMDSSLVYKIDLSGVPAGIYFFSIECEYERKLFKVIKIHS